MRSSVIILVFGFLCLGSGCVSSDKTHRGETLESTFTEPTARWMRSVMQHDFARANELITEGANPNEILNSWSPLGWALYFRNLLAVEYLLSVGADPNLVIPSYKFTPLGEAAHVKIDAIATSPMHITAGIDDEHYMRALLNAGGDPNLRLLEDNFLAVTYPFMRATGKGLLPNLKMMVEYGANLDLENRDGRSVYEFAARSGLDALDYLLALDREVPLEMLNATARELMLKRTSLKSELWRELLSKLRDRGVDLRAVFEGLPDSAQEYAYKHIFIDGLQLDRASPE